MDMDEFGREFDWLKAHPEFHERPATMTEFLGEEYLNISSKIRPGIRTALEDIFKQDPARLRISQHERAMLTGAIGIGKGQLKDDLVATPYGWEKIGYLTPGDEVIGSDGMPIKVTGVFPRGVLPVYKVSFTDGTDLTVDGDHLWYVTTPTQKARSQPGRVRSTRELMDIGVKTDRGQRRFHIPVSSGAAYDQYELLTIPAYTLGALLGDGGLTQSYIRFTTEDQEILDYLNAEIGSEFDLVGSRVDHNSYTWTVSRGGLPGRNPLIEALKNLDLWGKGSFTKSIPDAYKFASWDDRVLLLQGLMDTDGWVNSKIKYTEYCSVSKQLAEDVADLVRSLGGIAKIKYKASVKAYLVGVRTTFNPFRLSRKASLWTPNEKYLPAKMIDSIEPAGEGEVVCISVDAEDSLYVARAFTVTHNTTFASIALPYMAHWVLCLKDPQDYFNLLPGSRIAFMQMSTSEKQAKEVIFGDIQARIKNSKWFKENYQMDPKFTTQIRFDKDIWLLPGDSAETTFEGYNILGGILDEADSHKVTQDKDYAEQGYETIESRVASRFVDNSDPGREGHLGLVIIIGQMKKANGFAARKYREFQADKHAYTVHMSIWESFGWDKYTRPDGTRNSFWYQPKRRMIVPPEVGKMLDPSQVVEIPQAFAQQFRTNPEKALRDLAGIPPATSDPFISLVDAIEEAQEKWVTRVGHDSPVDFSCTTPKFAEWFRSNADPRKRAMHVDVAYSDQGDALGMAMGYVERLVEADGEEKPYIIIDFLFRVRAAPGTEIMLSDIRRIIYDLRDARRFRLKKVTYDGFESTDTIQQLRKKRFEADRVSVDKTMLPYEDLREAIYERRIEFPRYMTHLTVGGTSVVNIAYKELTELSIQKGKVDHPANGSKDVADCIAGVVYTLMGDRQYRRGVHRVSAPQEEEYSHPQNDNGFSAGAGIPVLPTLGGMGLKAPVPPGSLGGGMGLSVPPRLNPRGR